MTTSVQAQHTISVYEALEKASVEGVFTGSLTSVYDSVGISRSFYKRVFAILTDLSCITVTKRGHGTVKSEVVLHRAPSLEELEQWDLTRGPHSDKTLLESRLHVVEQRMGGLDVKTLLAEFGTRLTELEADVGKIKNTKTN